MHARDEGVTYAAIAEAAGTSSQAVQEIVRRHKRKVESRPGSLGVAGDIAAISTEDVSQSKVGEQSSANPVA
nr:hypothetical protein [Brevibacterium daeguense]